MKHNVFLYVKNHLGVLFALIFFGLAACEEEASCVTNNTNIARLQFTKLISNEGGNTEDDIQSVILVEANGSIPNTAIGDSTVHQIGLPLDPANNTTTFYIYRQLEEGGDFTVDTLVLRYQREQTLISPECGPDQRFFGLEVDKDLSTIDSIRVRNPDVDITTEPNLQVFTCRYEMTNELRLRFTHAADEEEATDTLFIKRIYTNTGKEDLIQDTLIVEGGNLTLGVPVVRSENQVQVILETDEALPRRYEVWAYYQLDTFQVADCLSQDRYRLDSLSLGDDPGIFTETEVSSETFNINNELNAEVTFQ